MDSMSGDETVPVKVADLTKWGEWSHFLDYGMAKDIRSYLPKPEQPVKVMLSELLTIGRMTDNLERHNALWKLLDRLGAENA